MPWKVETQKAAACRQVSSVVQRQSRVVLLTCAHRVGTVPDVERSRSTLMDCLPAGPPTLCRSASTATTATWSASVRARWGTAWEPRCVIVQCYTVSQRPQRVVLRFSLGQGVTCVAHAPSVVAQGGLAAVRAGGQRLKAADPLSRFSASPLAALRARSAPPSTTTLMIVTHIPKRTPCHVLPSNHTCRRSLVLLTLL